MLKAPLPGEEGSAGLESGVIPLAGPDAISRDLTEAAFLSTEIGGKAMPYAHNSSRHSYRLPKFTFDARDWTAILFFTNELLDRVSLHLPASATSWGALNPKEEEGRTRALKASVELQLNRPLPADFPWGRLSVYFDPQNFSGSLVFTYAHAASNPSQS